MNRIIKGTKPQTKYFEIIKHFKCEISNYGMDSCMDNAISTKINTFNVVLARGEEFEI